MAKVKSNVSILSLVELVHQTKSELKSWLTERLGPEFERWEYIEVIVNISEKADELHIPLIHPAVNFTNKHDQLLFEMAWSDKIVHNYNWARYYSNGADW